MPKLRKQRRLGQLPAGFKWRDGRPRWEPSPTRRRQGWKGCDLRGPFGTWLAKGPAIDKAEAICAAVRLWEAGEPVPAVWLAIAPKGAAAARGGRLGPRAITTLLEAYFASDKFQRLAEKTQADYRSKLKRLFETIAGDPAKAETVKALDIDVLLPPAFGEEGDFELERAYELLRESAGHHMANGVLATTSAWLGWCVKKKRVFAANPAELVERERPDGRIVVYEWPELVALVRHFDGHGLASIADAIILGVDLSWSQQDLLSLTRAQVSQDLHVKHRRIKTGVAGNPPLLAVGRQRVEAIFARWRDKTVQPLNLIVCELTGQPWAADTFRHHFAQGRAEVAKQLPAVADKQFRDLRDTTITYCYEAGLTVPQICSRSLHSPSRAQVVIEEHYGAIGQAMTDAAAEKLDAHFKAMGYTFDVAGEG
ncbi:hypothetical protein [Phenylobacterium sp.]|uniref:hypothetical protein n=1 Tax=Phenylobacterium sp. TaxID=1871053 RepID=UPI002DF17203|nr:hypothetical protein [Phenylobacterium sp.]